ncbi:hypothetical protein [Rheinheimera sp. MMS21-TC3]|uniref:hypothetical protein n=1 Tax=Rheinheimera sp. MMS21-TC3 TaxID=3072790 RepID=UPI0028C4EB05|nr:hypothetical protein [Rheinheimera sp. MMS21-TC3]WNO60410.1 hypothetical protein RDV63_05445 [Rheinheimera sp. MMS21-TC3]
MQSNLTVNQTEAAKMVGVHPRTIQRLEKANKLNRLSGFNRPRYSVNQVKQLAEEISK